MANTDIKVTNEAFIRDVSDSPITGGSNIYLRVTKVGFPYKALVDQKAKILVNPDFTSEDNSDTGSNWNRRKSYASYQGFESLVINLTGKIDLDNPGSFSSDTQLATPARLWKLWSTPTNQPYYFWDSKIGSALINVDYDPTLGNPYPAGSIPVIIEDFNINWTKNSLNQIDYSLTLREDRI